MNKFQRKLIALLNDVGTKYLLIGGYAMQAHGITRCTHDIDLLLSPTVEDANKTLGALAVIDARFLVTLKVEDLLRPLVRIPVPSIDHVEIDLLTSIEHIDFEDVFSRSLWKNFAGQGCHVASITDLIRLKELSEKKCRKDALNINFSESIRETAKSLADRDLADIVLLQSV